MSYVTDTSVLGRCRHSSASAIGAARLDAPADARRRDPQLSQRCGFVDIQHEGALLNLFGAALISGAISVAARTSRSLDASGAIAAFVIGTIALATGGAWGIFVVGWFAAASALSRVGREAKAARVAGIVEKGGARDAWQVLANGGVFAALLVARLFVLRLHAGSPSPRSDLADSLSFGAVAALIAAGADTWATEVGTLIGGIPRSIRSWRAVAPGTSGAVTASGTAAMAVSAAAHACAAVALGLVDWWGPVLAESSLDVASGGAPTLDLVLGTAHRSITMAGIGALTLAGCAGALADTLAGAYAQERRWCPSCSQWTEQPVHTCGARTRVAGGVRGASNDVVNFLCTLVGAASAIGLFWFLPLHTS